MWVDIEENRVRMFERLMYECVLIETVNTNVLHNSIVFFIKYAYTRRYQYFLTGENVVNIPVIWVCVFWQIMNIIILLRNSWQIVFCK